MRGRTRKWIGPSGAGVLDGETKILGADRVDLDVA